MQLIASFMEREDEDEEDSETLFPEMTPKKRDSNIQALMQYEIHPSFII